jgi:putative nucleotidyltransferase with HDIG domain
MRTPRRILYAYGPAMICWIVAVVGVARLVLYAVRSPDQAVLSVTLAGIACWFAVWQVLQGSVAVTVGALVSYLTVALLGTLPATGVKVLAFGMAALFYRGDRGQRLRFLIVNGAILPTTVLISGTVYTLLGGVVLGVPGARFSARLIPAFIALAAAYTLTNIVLMSVWLWFRSDSNILASIRDLVRRFWVNELIFALIGVVALTAYGQMHYWGLLAVFGLLVAVRFTFQMYADAHRVRSEMAQMLAHTLRYKDQYTGEHSMRVANLAVRIGREMGLSDLQLETLHDSALLHDIGKVAIPDAVLIKPGPLDPAEKRSMARHVGAGGEILEQSPHLKELATLIRAHHIDFDATTKDLPLEARIIAVADAFDAMTSDRPYRKALPTEEAVRRLHEGAGTQFDPGVVAALLRALAAPAASPPSGGQPPVRPEAAEATASSLPEDWPPGLQATARPAPGSARA